MKSYVIQKDWATVAHEGDEASCRQWIANTVSLGFGKRANFEIVEGAKAAKAAIAQAKR